MTQDQSKISWKVPLDYNRRLISNSKMYLASKLAETSIKLLKIVVVFLFIGFVLVYRFYPNYIDNLWKMAIYAPLMLIILIIMHLASGLGIAWFIAPTVTFTPNGIIYMSGKAKMLPWRFVVGYSIIDIKDFPNYKGLVINYKAKNNETKSTLVFNPIEISENTIERYIKSAINSTSV
ncbi:MAG: hypothetical protein SNJ70_04300 [Armatimonadota bacterium]